MRSSHLIKTERWNGGIVPHATAIKEITDMGGLIVIQLIAADLIGVSTGDTY